MDPRTPRNDLLTEEEFGSSGSMDGYQVNPHFPLDCLETLSTIPNYDMEQFCFFGIGNETLSSPPFENQSSMHQSPQHSHPASENTPRLDYGRDALLQSFDGGRPLIRHDGFNHPDAVQQDVSSSRTNAVVTAMGDVHHTALPFGRFQGSMHTNRRANIPYPSCDANLGDFESLRQVGSAATTSRATGNRRTRPVYFCEVPGCTSRGFTQRHNFQYHLRSHGGHRPFRCERCGRRFNSRSDLKRHGRRVHRAC
ncbi:hypothetical protein PM082_024174 [Marasmius tenuissimus]|nr:hypothetical protein PM082_024174 [Marasmius tenuissimus]